MTCDNCGADCQGKYCTPCGRAESRDGDLESRLQDTGLPTEDPLEFLGANVHKCDPCGRVFGSLKALAKHGCQPTIDAGDVPMQSIDGGAALVEIGPDPSMFERHQVEDRGESS